MKRALKYATTHIHIYDYVIIILNNFERNFRNVIFRISRNCENIDKLSRNEMAEK